MKPTNKMNQAVDLVRKKMNEGQYGLHEGCVYKKIKECEYTYIYCSDVKKYLMNLLGNDEVADVVTPYVSKLIGLLSEPSYRLIKPIKIDYNFIEVKDGFCFDISRKKFVRHPKTLKGSPRAYVRYTYDINKKPNPEPFIEGKIIYSNFISFTIFSKNI